MEAYKANCRGLVRTWGEIMAFFDFEIIRVLGIGNGKGAVPFPLNSDFFFFFGGDFFWVPPKKNIPVTGPSFTQLTTEFFAPQNLNFPYKNARIRKESARETRGGSRAHRGSQTPKI